ncbi:hypothetical protein GA0061105_13114 [Rhizobium aethiopicum]|uniref:Uncharacterized protein n=1 Tax=Rhizobium aethiopicum TaxID=1138170 RepID=A0A1C3YC45_9HYPH|nr:hypothetical protein GA0061105_13114 [Rhizobium aethiopicum]
MAYRLSKDLDRILYVGCAVAGLIGVGASLYPSNPRRNMLPDDLIERHEGVRSTQTFSKPWSLLTSISKGAR